MYISELAVIWMHEAVIRKWIESHIGPDCERESEGVRVCEREVER